MGRITEVSGARQKDQFLHNDDHAWDIDRFARCTAMAAGASVTGIPDALGQIEKDFEQTWLPTLGVIGGTTVLGGVVNKLTSGGLTEFATSKTGLIGGGLAFGGLALWDLYHDKQRLNAMGDAWNATWINGANFSKSVDSSRKAYARSALDLVGASIGLCPLKTEATTAAAKFAWSTNCTVDAAKCVNEAEALLKAGNYHDARIAFNSVLNYRTGKYGNILEIANLHEKVAQAAVLEGCKLKNKPVLNFIDVYDLCQKPIVGPLVFSPMKKLGFDPVAAFGTLERKELRKISELHHDKAVNIVKGLGNESASIDTLRDWASFYKDRNKFSRARECADVALQLQGVKLPELTNLADLAINSKPSVATTLKLAGDIIYAEGGNYREADKYYHNYLELAKELPNKNFAELADVYTRSAENAAQQSDWNMAAGMYGTAFDFKTKLHLTDHAELYKDHIRWADANRAQGPTSDYYQRAEELYQTAREKIHNTLCLDLHANRENSQTRHLIEGLTDIYQKTGNETKLGELRNSLSEFARKKAADGTAAVDTKLLEQMKIWTEKPEPVKFRRQGK